MGLSGMKHLFDLKDRVVLITGAGGHLGSKMAVGLAQQGAHVVLWGRSLEPLKKVAQTISDFEGSVSIEKVDLLDKAQLDKCLSEFEAKYARLDTIVNNAYAGRGGTCATASCDDFEKAYQISVVSPFRIIQSLRPLLRESGMERLAGSSVINIATMYGIVSPDQRIYNSADDVNPPFYGASKAGMLQMTKYMACEFAADKIRVNAISPGPFPNAESQNDDSEFCEKLVGKVPLGRLGEPGEIVGPVLFLASDASSYVTGANIVVDGGWTVW